MERPERRQDTVRVNERIRVREIRLVDEEGNQVGVVSPEEGISRAKEVGLDLVEVAPGASPPVCRIMDYGRYKYEQKKKSSKGKGHAASLKEVKLRPRTDQHDLEFKLRSARRFLMEGDKVKITIQFRGREIVHRELGYEQLDVVKDMLGNLAAVENPPRMEGRFLSMILVPNKEGIAEAKKAEEEAQKTGGDAGPDDQAEQKRAGGSGADEKEAAEAGH